jgi:hypothetical protein
MIVQTRRILPAVLVLLVLLASQVGYAAELISRPSGHCAGATPSEEPCRLPLWLTCCEDRAAVGTAFDAPGPGSLLALPLEPSRDPAQMAARSLAARGAEIPPDTPLSRSVVLLI